MSSPASNADTLPMETPMRAAGTDMLPHIAIETQLHLLPAEILPAAELLIFDVDHTLTRPASGGTFRRHADDWEWMPGRRELLRGLSLQRRKMAIATNQAGVGWGALEQDVIERALVRVALLLEPSSPLDEDLCDLARNAAACREYGCMLLKVCYSHPQAPRRLYRCEDARRKPGPGMLYEACREHRVAPGRALMIGDRSEDRAAAHAAGVGFLWSWDLFGDPAPRFSATGSPIERSGGTRMFS